MPVALRKNAKGPEVEALQKALLELDYELPVFGADGVLGGETLTAVQEFQEDHGLGENAVTSRGVSYFTLEAILRGDTKAPKRPPANVEVEGTLIRLVKPSEQGPKSKGLRPWSRITGICLHQMAVLFPEDPQRYRRVTAHLCTTQGGRALLVHNLDSILWAANSFNARDISIELSGAFPGIEGDLDTFWRPKSRPNRVPNILTEAQVEATLFAIGWCLEEVASHGGKIQYLHAHRQSSKMRTSDPGSAIWRRIGLVAKERWGLTDGGPNYVAGGYPIPKQWDPSYTKDYRDHT